MRPLAVGLTLLATAAAIAAVDRWGPTPAVVQTRTPNGATFDSVGDTARLFYGNLDPDSIVVTNTLVPAIHSRNRWGEDAMEVVHVVWKDGARLRQDTIWQRR